MTFIVYSGTSQLTVLPLMAGSTAVLTMVLAAALAGLRFVVYSAVLSRHLSRVPLPLRLGTCFLTIDGPLAVLTQAQARGPLVQRVALLNGANVVTALVWCAQFGAWHRAGRAAAAGRRAQLPGGAGAAGLRRADAGGSAGLGRRRGQHRGDAAGRALAAQAGHLCRGAGRRGRRVVGLAPAAQGLKAVHYSPLELWVLIALLSLLTLLSRSFFVLLPRRWQPRGRVEQALRYAPLAALLAITVPEVVQHCPRRCKQAAPAWAIATDARLVSALVLAAVIRLTRHTLWGLAGRHRRLPGAVATGRLSGIITASATAPARIHARHLCISTPARCRACASSRWAS